MNAAEAPRMDLPPVAKGLRGLFARLTRDPNAIWMREMRQSARLGRTPWILFSLTLSISLLMCSIGGLASAENASPAQLGGALFQVFFSIAYLVVVVVGPAVAANSIASEREGRTWEAVLLTGLTPKDIARGKFLAAYTTMGLYIVVLAPVGALSFLFGGVTATEVVVAFVFLFLVAALGVAFGLAVSSLMTSLRGAIVVTLMLAIFIGPLLYSIFGVGCSIPIHKMWSDVPEALPIWLPLAYSRAPFGYEYVLILFVLPLLLIVIPAWFLYEATISNLTGEADDRSTGLKKWFAACTPLLAIVCAVPSLIADGDDERSIWSIIGLCSLITFLGFCTMLFAFEPPGPSRRVRIHWTRAGAGALTRFMGPGLMKTSTLVMLLGVVGMVIIAITDMAALEAFGTSTDKETRMLEIFVVASYATPFFIFLVGFNAWLRARGNTPWITRLISSGVLFLIAAGPWVVAAIGGVIAKSDDKDWLAIAAPSPFYVFAMLSSLRSFSSSSLIIPAGFGCAIGWGALGLGLLAAAGRRAHRTVTAHDAAVAAAGAALDAEEVQRRAWEASIALQAVPAGAPAAAATDLTPGPTAT